MGSWGCPHEFNGVCQRVNNLPCDPGMRGCVLYGRFVFSNPAKNRPVKVKAGKTPEGKGAQTSPPGESGSNVGV